MKNKIICRLAIFVAGIFAFGFAACAQIIVPGTYKTITIDGSFDDWSGVPLAYTAAAGTTSTIQYENVYIANDQNNLYIQFTLYSPWVAFQDSTDNLFIDTDNNPATGYSVGGIGSEMLIQWGGGYDERNGGFNSGGVNNLGWNIAGSAGETNYELSISLGATYASDGAPVFTGNTIAILLEGDTTNYVSQEFAPSAGGLVYTLAANSVTINAQPASQLIVEGSPVTFAVGALGVPPIRYQWYFGDTAISGATNASYTIASTLPTNSGNYYVAVGNSGSTTNSSVASLTVLLSSIPPNITNISTAPNQVVVTFSKAVDPVTAGNAANYSINNGVTVLAAVQNPNNPAQVTLTTGVALNFGTVYSLTVNGVKDLFGNVAHVTGQFARDITIDGSFGDWAGISPVYSSAAPSGNTDAADFQYIYVYNDANYYYFRVTLWTDIDPDAGQFPFYVNMFFDTDNNPNTGYSAIGSDMLVQSGFSYQEKDGGFNDGYGINGLDWLCLPAAPGTNFEFQMSMAATFGEDGTSVFTTNIIDFLFQGMTPGFVVENTVPPNGGVLSYTNVSFISPSSLPLGKLAIDQLSGSQVAVIWDAPGTLQSATNLSGSWTSLPAATSPYVISATGTGQFFRLTR
jgi:hypothetical protein